MVTTTDCILYFYLLGPFSFYSGVVNTKFVQSVGGKFMKWLGFDSLEKLLRKDCERSVAALFPLWPRSSPDLAYIMEDSFKELNRVYEGLKYVYDFNAGLWSNYGDFDKFFGQVM